MDAGQLVLISGKLLLGTGASFLAITLWSRNRDLPWTFMVFGTLAFWAGTLYDILQGLGVTGFDRARVGTVPLLALVLGWLPWFFVAGAFLAMAVRKPR